MEKQIRTLDKFGGAPNEDVVQWLQDIEEVFDRAQLRLTNKYIAVQSFLTNGAAMWFRYNKCNIVDWPTFQIEIVKAFQLPTSSKISSTSTILQCENVVMESIDIIENPKTDSVEEVSAAEEETVELVQENEEEEKEDLEDKCLRGYAPDHYSPMLVTINDLDLEIQDQCADVAAAYDQLGQQGESVIKLVSVKTDVEDVFKTVAGSISSLTAEHSLINTVVPQDVQYSWSDEYQPRQPHVFNKVHTYYDCGQYDKQHYDKDNPLPTTIQGYKSNIVYPVLIVKIRTPSYSLLVCEVHGDFSMLRLQAEAPYEDIAFKSVSQEWNNLCQDTFRCHFQNGIYKLWFHFRKWKYRTWKYRKWKHRKWKYHQWQYC